MGDSELNIVTGAFGYTGKYITKRLLSMGKSVRTLTGHTNSHNPFGEKVKVYPFNFNNPIELARSMRGATTLYNTYWIRFPHGRITYDSAVENTRVLIRAAVEAGVRKIVHVSIANASEGSPYPYFRGKGALEREIMNSGLSYAIIRPTVIFGPEDILINNIAWLIRKLPVFAVPGKGDYCLQPIFVEDMADLAIKEAHRDENTIIDAVGPEIFTFEALVRLIAQIVRRKVFFIRTGPGLVHFLSGMVGLAVKDVVLTEAEVQGLMDNLLVSAGAPTGQMKLSQWLQENAGEVGKAYASEINRHYR
ncbi:MAG: SDR family oxidoreductase [Bacillota bacterium]